MGQQEVGKKEQKVNSGNLTLTERRLIQNYNIQTLIDGFQNSPVESNPEKSLTSESPDKKQNFGGGH